MIFNIQILERLGTVSKIAIQRGKIQSLIPCGSQYQRGGVAAEEQSPRPRDNQHRDEGMGRCRAESQAWSCVGRGCGCLLLRGQAVSEKTFGKRFLHSDLGVRLGEPLAIAATRLVAAASHPDTPLAPGCPLICSSGCMERAGPSTHG